MDSEGSIREEFVAFLKLNRVRAVDIADALVKCLENLGLSLSELCGQGYVVHLQWVDINQVFRQEFEKSNPKQYTLNVLPKSCSVPEIRNCIDSIKSITIWVKYSPKREALLKAIAGECTYPASWQTLQGGALPETNEIVTLICSCHNFFSHFFCANTFYTSLLLIVCALKWYIKSLYRHFFLEDISKHARVTQKKNCLICATIDSQGPWPQRTKLGTNVAKGISCDIVVFFFFSVNPPWVIVLRRGGTPKNRAIFLVPPLLNTITQGGVHRKKKIKPLYHN